MSHQVQNANVKLPTIDLPSFDGDFTKWRTFEDTFSALIDVYTRLTDVQKLCYLRSALKGEAVGAISALETTEVNYQIALNILKNRFCHHRMIVYSHVNALLDMKRVTNIRTFLNTIEQHIHSLKTLNIAVDKWDAILIPILLAKLDSSIVLAWNTHISTKFSKNIVPTYDCFTTFFIQHKSNLTVAFATNHVKQINYCSSVNIRSRVSSFQTTLSCLIVPQVTADLPQSSFDTSLIHLPDNVKLADPTYNKKQPIDILMKSSVFWGILKNNKIKLGNHLMATGTKLGWVITGQTHLSNHTIPPSTNSVATDYHNIDNTCNHFGNLTILTQINQSCPLRTNKLKLILYRLYLVMTRADSL